MATIEITHNTSGLESLDMALSPETSSLSLQQYQQRVATVIATATAQVTSELYYGPIYTYAWQSSGDLLVSTNTFQTYFTPTTWRSISQYGSSVSELEIVDAAGDRVTITGNLSYTGYPLLSGANNGGNISKAGVAGTLPTAIAGFDQFSAGFSMTTVSSNGAIFGSVDSYGELLANGTGENLYLYMHGSQSISIDNQVTLGGGFIDYITTTYAPPGTTTPTDSVVISNIRLDTTLSTVGSYPTDVLIGNDTVTLRGVLGSEFNGLGGNDTINGGGSHDTIFGGIGNDDLRGNGGNDILAGGAGKDNLNGGLGNDTFVFNAMVGTSSDTTRVAVTGTANDIGQDTITGFNFTLDTIKVVATNVVNFVHGTDTAIGTATGEINTGVQGDFTQLTALIELNQTTDNNWNDRGDIAITFVNPSTPLTEVNFEARLQYNLTGTIGNNILVGGNLADILRGNAGSDILNGRLGKDNLTGGAGSDIFRFTTALGVANIDKITDFVAADDTIQLENSIFTMLGTTATGAINTNFLKTIVSGGATDSDDYIVYNRTTGALYYDANGSTNGLTDAVQFATLGTNLNLTNTDFVLI